MSNLLREELQKVNFVDTFTLKNYEKLAKTRIKYISKDIQKLRSLLHQDQKTEEFTNDLLELKNQRTACSKFLNVLIGQLTHKDAPRADFDPKREFQLLLSAPVVDMTKYNGKQQRR